MPQTVLLYRNAFVLIKLNANYFPQFPNVQIKKIKHVINYDISFIT